MSYTAPVIHYNFDSNLTNHGSGGSTYDATIVNGSLDFDTTNKVVGSASMEIKAGASRSNNTENNSLEISNMDKSAVNFTISVWFQTPTGNNNARLFHSFGMNTGQMLIWLSNTGTQITRWSGGYITANTAMYTNRFL
jgi:hypothetical protein